MLEHPFEVMTKAARKHFQHALCRIVYLRPNMYSDEQIAVGVATSTYDGKLFRTVASSESARSALKDFFSEEIQEQTLVGLDLLDRKIRHKIGRAHV